MRETDFPEWKDYITKTYKNQLSDYIIPVVITQRLGYFQIYSRTRLVRAIIWCYIHYTVDGSQLLLWGTAMWPEDNKGCVCTSGLVKVNLQMWYVCDHRIWIQWQYILYPLVYGWRSFFQRFGAGVSCIRLTVVNYKCVYESVCCRQSPPESYESSSSVSRR